MPYYVTLRTLLQRSGVSPSCYSVETATEALQILEAAKASNLAADVLDKVHGEVAISDLRTCAAAEAREIFTVVERDGIKP